MSVFQVRRITGRHVLVALLLFFGAVTAVNVVMIRAAVSTFGGVETPSSYRAGLDFTQELANVAAQDARGWQVDATVEGASEVRALAVAVLDADGAAVGQLDARARFAHPVDERLDRAVELVGVGGGRYTGTGAVPAGVWDLKLEILEHGHLVYRSSNRLRLP